MTHLAFVIRLAFVKMLAVGVRRSSFLAFPKLWMSISPKVSGKEIPILVQYVVVPVRLPMKIFAVAISFSILSLLLSSSSHTSQFPFPIEDQFAAHQITSWHSHKSQQHRILCLWLVVLLYPTQNSRYKGIFK